MEDAIFNQNDEADNMYTQTSIITKVPHNLLFKNYRACHVIDMLKGDCTLMQTCLTALNLKMVKTV